MSDVDESGIANVYIVSMKMNRMRERERDLCNISIHTHRYYICIYVCIWRNVCGK